MIVRYTVRPSTELYHFGIKGMKWYQRRYQNPDGSLTTAGRARYSTKKAKLEDKVAKYEDKAAKYGARGAKKEKGFVGRKFLLESQRHYNNRVITKQGKAAADKAKAAEYERKAHNARNKIADIDRELNMEFDTSHLPQARMTDSVKTYRDRVKQSYPYTERVANYNIEKKKDAINKLRGDAAGLTKREQKEVIKAYKAARRELEREEKRMLKANRIAEQKKAKMNEAAKTYEQGLVDIYAEEAINDVYKAERNNGKGPAEARKAAQKHFERSYQDKLNKWDAGTTRDPESAEVTKRQLAYINSQIDAIEAEERYDDKIKKAFNKRR